MSSTAYLPGPQESTYMFAAIGPGATLMYPRITVTSAPWADWQMAVCDTREFWPIKHWKNTES